MRVGIVGLGIMGQAMVGRLLQAGHEVSVHNRTPAKADAAIAAGAVWRDSPADVAASSHVVITLVTDGEALEQVAFGDRGILTKLPIGSVHCDMSTIAPASATAVAARYKQAGRRYIQAPVLGSKGQIEAGVLLIFAGGSPEDVEIARPVWTAFSQRQWLFETAEQSSAMKLACNTLIAQSIVGLGQTMAIAKSAGIDGPTVLDILGSSALTSPMIASKGKTILDSNFAANFVVRNLLKDLRLAADYADGKALPLIANDLNREIFTRAVDAGFGDEDYSAVVKLILPNG